MILFRDDWKKYSNAIIDTSTTNKSFVRIASLYKSMGIKNNAFMLALINPALQGVDPFDVNNLSMETKAAIALECKINPWYFFREIAIAPSKTGNAVYKFEANRGNMALYFLFFNHITVFLIQMRQTGKSFSVDTLVCLLLNILCTNTQINLLTKDDILRVDNIRRIKEIDMEMPAYLRQRGRSDSNNFEGISVKSVGNELKAHVPQSSPKAAEKMGRGLTSPIFIGDETPFQNNIAIALPAALAAGTTARELARQNGEPYGTIMTTTAGKRDDKDGKYIYGLLESSAPWDEAFFDCLDNEELSKVINKICRNDRTIVNCTFDHRQLGKTDEWLDRSIKATMNPNVDAINRDFFNVWTSGTETSPLSVAMLEKISKSIVPSVFLQIDPKNHYSVRWYIDEGAIRERMANSHYILSSDTSDAAGGDAISILLVDIQNGETVAAATINETNLIAFAEWLCDWFVRFENFTAIIERRSTGSAIIDYLLLMLPVLGIDPFRRIFNLCVNDHKEDEYRWREINVSLNRRPQSSYVTHKKTFGFATSGSGMASRTELYSTTLQLAAKKAGDKVKDTTTVNQILGLVTNNGRVDHAPGAHDDMVIAWLLAFWLMTQGKNLSYYGIDSKKILSYSKDIEEMSDSDYEDYMFQQDVRKKIEEIYEMMTGERDSNVMRRLEHQLMNYNRKLILREDETFSIDDLINSLKEKRRSLKLENSNWGYLSR